MALTSKSPKGWKHPNESNQSVTFTDEWDVKWYLLDCRYQFGDWIEQHDNKLWKVHGAYHRAHYWVHEKLFSLILLRDL